MSEIAQLDSKLLSVSQSTRYPLLIHQIYSEGLNNIPDKWRDSPIEWKRLHPDHIYTLWTSEMCDSLIRQFEPNCYEFYSSCSYDIQRTLIARYAILKRYGGIYSSLSVTPRFSMSDKIKDCEAGVYMVKSDDQGISFSTSLLISKRGSLLWDQVLKVSILPLPEWCRGSYCEVTMSAGFRRLTKVANVYTEPIEQLPEALFNSTSENESKYLDSHDSGSWYSWDSIPIRLFIKYRNVLFIVALVLIVVLLFLSFVGLFSIRVR